MSQAYEVLVFDLQGTATDFHTPVHNAVKKIFHEIDPNIDTDNFVNLWRQQYFARLKSSPDETTSSYEIYRVGLESLLYEHHLAIDPAIQHELILSWEHLIPWPDTLVGLKRLREKFVIIALSNARMSSIINISRSAGINWDAIFSAQTIGAFKPDPCTYLTVLETLAIPAHKALMIASHPYDLRGAAKVGMHTAYVYRAQEYGMRTQQYQENIAYNEFTYYINNFNELADQLL